MESFTCCRLACPDSKICRLLPRFLFSERFKSTLGSRASLSARLKDQSKTVRLPAPSSRRCNDTSDLWNLAVKREAVSPRQAMVRYNISFFVGSCLSCQDF
jgi:hypothetical protein